VVPPLFYGVNWDGRIADGVYATRQRTWDDMPRVGAEAVRTPFLWANAQPERDGGFLFKRTDELMTLAAVRRLDLLPIVTLAPRWARTGDHRYSPPSDPKDYDAYLRALIGRYGPNGSFWKQHHHLPRRPIREWQIWNEPNVRAFWHPKNKKRWAEEYGKLLRPAFRAVRRYDPRAKVVLAGLANYSWSSLDRLYRTAGIHGKFDVADVHPFTARKHGVVEIVRRFKRVLSRHGDGSKPVWVGELGLPGLLVHVGLDVPVERHLPVRRPHQIQPLRRSRGPGSQAVARRVQEERAEGRGTPLGGSG